MVLRIAIAQVSPKKGDYAENLRRIGGVLVIESPVQEEDVLLMKNAFGKG